ncbi:hypothetical protein T439DRAFT_345061 [Meredithblackwellia eburnea MCA 4105]
MVKLAPSLIVAALTLASSSTLAAPTPTTAPEADAVALQDEPCEDSNDKEQEKIAQQLLARKDRIPTIAERQVNHVADQLTSSEKIRRGIPLIATGTNLHDKRDSEGLNKRDLVGTLGLTGALAPLGVGGVVATVETTIDGLPVVGGPVGGLVHTVDDTVGLGSLLNPKPSVHGTKEKRQVQNVPGALAGLTGNLPLASVTGGLPLNGLGGLPLSSLTGGLPLASLAGLAGNLPISSLTGGLPLSASSDPLAILGQIAQLQGQLAKLVPSGSTFNPPSYLSRVSANYAQTPGSASPDVQAELAALLAQLQKQAGGSVPATQSLPLGSQQTPVDPLSGLTIAEAVAYGLIPSSVLDSFASNLPIGNQFSASVYHHHHNETEGTGFNSTSLNSAKAGRKAVDLPSSALPTQSQAPVPIPAPTVAAPSAPVATPSAPVPLDLGETPQPIGDSASSGDGFVAAPSKVIAVEPPTQSTIYLDNDSGSEYSDEEEEEGEDQSLLSEPAPWTVTSSSTMASTPSQALATAEAMSMTTSEAGSTAVPTSTPERRRWARNLD